MWWQWFLRLWAYFCDLYLFFYCCNLRRYVAERSAHTHTHTHFTSVLFQEMLNQDAGNDVSLINSKVKAQLIIRENMSCKLAKHQTIYNLFHKPFPTATNSWEVEATPPAGSSLWYLWAILKEKDQKVRRVAVLSTCGMIRKKQTAHYFYLLKQAAEAAWAWRSCFLGKSLKENINLTDPSTFILPNQSSDLICRTAAKTTQPLKLATLQQWPLKLGQFGRNSRG